MSVKSILAVALVSILALGCISGPDIKEVAVPAGPVDGRLLRCLHKENEQERDHCLLYLSAMKKKGEYCSLLRDAGRKSVCNSVLTEKVADCLEAFTEEPEVGRNYCLATYGKNESRCLRIKDDKIRGECVSLVSFIKLDKMACGILNDTSLRSDCIREFAVDYGDHLMCKLIYDNSSRDDCYLDYAVAEPNAGFCDIISDETKKGLCRELVKVRMLDGRKCASVSSKDERAWCINAVAYDRADERFCRLHADFEKQFACSQNVKQIR